MYFSGPDVLHTAETRAAVQLHSAHHEARAAHWRSEAVPRERDAGRRTPSSRPGAGGDIEGPISGPSRIGL